MGLGTFLAAVFYFPFKQICKCYITFQNYHPPITQFIQTNS